MDNYRYVQENEKYVIYDGDTTLKTPAGNTVTTNYRPLADRIVLDLTKFGYSFHSSSSILAWHFTMIDNFSKMSHEEVEQLLQSSFLGQPDWTCVEAHGTAWRRAFGDVGTRYHRIRAWLHDATIMQMTAACCIGNAYESLNMAFSLAMIMETYTDESRDAKLNELAQMVADTMQFGSYSDIYTDFKTFELYYGIHLQENGPILSDFVEEDDDENDDEDLDLADLEGESVEIEALVGRNFYHYTDYEVDAVQPLVFPVSDFEINNSEDDAENDNEENSEENLPELADYLPDDCWVKRYVDDNDPSTCYLLYLVLDEDGVIQSVGCLSETTQLFGGGGFFFMIPGLEMSGSKFYDEEIVPPEKVMEDAKRLMERPVLPSGFSFIGRRLPQEMIDEGGNGGSNTNYTFALQSAYRSAYTHLSIDTSEDGIIEDFSYSSYQSSGSTYGDMFSRPVLLSDKREEAVDMLLYIFDKYSDEELKQIGVS